MLFFALVVLYMVDDHHSISQFSLERLGPTVVLNYFKLGCLQLLLITANQTNALSWYKRTRGFSSDRLSLVCRSSLATSLYFPFDDVGVVSHE